MPRRITQLARLTSTILIAGALAACDRQTTPLAPGSIVFSPNAAASIQLVPQALPISPLGSFACPMSSPFATSFNLVVGAANTDLVFQRLTLQPFDGRGVAGLSTVLTAENVVGVSGSPLIAARTSRTFALHPAFGCGISAPRSLFTELILVDGFGSTHRSTLTARFLP